jgi:hypothetical protein
VQEIEPGPLNLLPGTLTTRPQRWSLTYMRYYYYYYYCYYHHHHYIWPQAPFIRFVFSQIILYIFVIKNNQGFSVLLLVAHLADPSTVSSNIEVICATEMLMSINQTGRCHIPGNGTINSHCCDNQHTFNAMSSENKRVSAQLGPHPLQEPPDICP